MLSFKASDMPAISAQYIFLTATEPVISQGVIDDIVKAAATVILGLITKAGYEWIASMRTRHKARKAKKIKPQQ